MNCSVLRHRRFKPEFKHIQKSVDQRNQQTCICVRLFASWRTPQAQSSGLHVGSCGLSPSLPTNPSNYSSVLVFPHGPSPQEPPIIVALARLHALSKRQTEGPGEGQMKLRGCHNTEREGSEHLWHKTKVSTKDLIAAAGYQSGRRKVADIKWPRCDPCLIPL